MDAFEFKMYKEEQRLPISERKAINDYCNNAQKAVLIASHPIQPKLKTMCLHFKGKDKFQIIIGTNEAIRIMRYIFEQLEFIEKNI